MSLLLKTEALARDIEKDEGFGRTCVIMGLQNYKTRRYSSRKVAVVFYFFAEGYHWLHLSLFVKVWQAFSEAKLARPYMAHEFFGGVVDNLAISIYLRFIYMVTRFTLATSKWDLHRFHSIPCLIHMSHPHFIQINQYQWQTLSTPTLSTYLTHN